MSHGGRVHRILITLFVAISCPAFAAEPAAARDDKERSFRDTLAMSAEAALHRLGRDDGFARSEQMHIVLPERLQRPAERLRRLGMGRYPQALEMSLNRVAEAALPSLRQPLLDAIARVPFNEFDVDKHAREQSAVRYFQRVSARNMSVKLLRQVHAAAIRLHVLESYQQLSGRAAKLGLLRGETAPNLEEYITAKALDALYATMAEEERAIRAYSGRQAQRSIHRVSKRR
jgi:hypothetical protein